MPVKKLEATAYVDTLAMEDFFVVHVVDSLSRSPRQGSSATLEVDRGAFCSAQRRLDFCRVNCVPASCRAARRTPTGRRPLRRRRAAGRHPVPARPAVAQLSSRKPTRVCGAGVLEPRSSTFFFICVIVAGCRCCTSGNERIPSAAVDTRGPAAVRTSQAIFATRPHEGNAVGSSSARGKAIGAGMGGKAHGRSHRPESGRRRKCKRGAMGRVPILLRTSSHVAASCSAPGTLAAKSFVARQEIPLWQVSFW